MPVSILLNKCKVRWSDFEFDTPFVLGCTPYAALGSQGPQGIFTMRCCDDLACLAISHSQQHLARSHTAVLEEPASYRVVSLHVAYHDISSLYKVVHPSLLTPRTTGLKVTTKVLGTKIDKERKEALQKSQ